MLVGAGSPTAPVAPPSSDGESAGGASLTGAPPAGVEAGRALRSARAPGYQRNESLRNAPSSATGPPCLLSARDRDSLPYL